MIISVVSGKGGSGKSLVAISLALSLANEETVQLLDCNVEASNAHVFLNASSVRKETVSILVPRVDKNKCTFCGKCAEVCAYGAIVLFAKNLLVFPELCRGCGVCTRFCLDKALCEQEREIGFLESGHSNGVAFVCGRINTGETMTAPLIAGIMESAGHRGTVIIDAAPAKSCTSWNVVKKSDFCLLATEPTHFGLHDLVWTVNTVNALHIPYGIVLNRAGSEDAGVEEYCLRKSIPILLTLPHNREFAELYSRGIALVDGMPAWKERFVELHDKIGEIVSA